MRERCSLLPLVLELGARERVAAVVTTDLLSHAWSDHNLIDKYFRCNMFCLSATHVIVMFHTGSQLRHPLRLALHMTVMRSKIQYYLLRMNE